MLWSERYTAGQQPSEAQIREFVATPLWDDLANHLQKTHNSKPKLFHSSCSMQDGYFKGWNVKYKKGGKALCTLYPKEGYFVALINVGAQESAEADLLVPLLDSYTQGLYARAKAGYTGKSLAIEVTSESILQDVEQLIALRAHRRKKAEWEAVQVNSAGALHKRATPIEQPPK